MRPRLETLKRLVSLYDIVEEIHSAELQRMTSAVREAEEAIGLQREVVRLAGQDGRRALTTGDRMALALADTQREISDWKRPRLEQIRLEREEHSNVAKEQYVASRLKSDQMKRVVEDATERVAMEEGRRLQAHSDDRFLARRRWTEAKEESRRAQMNGS
jgi:hypothetical protein